MEPANRVADHGGQGVPVPDRVSVLRSGGRTRPRRPQTNGKAESSCPRCSPSGPTAAIYASSTERTAALNGWLFRYNHHRKHSALGRKPPAARLTELHNTPLGSYS